MEIYIVLAVAFILGALLSFYWWKITYQKQLDKAKSTQAKILDELWVDKTILEQKIVLMNQQWEQASKVVYY
jgi:hypothetical protein